MLWLVQNRVTEEISDSIHVKITGNMVTRNWAAIYSVLVLYSVEI